MHACIGPGHGNPLQYSCLENPRDGGAWWAAIYGVAQSWTRLKRLSSSSSSSLLKFTSIELVMPSSHLILYRSPSPPALNLSQHQGLFQWVSSLHQVAKELSFSFNISPSNEHPGLISFSMKWLDLLEVQGTLKSLLQHHSSKSSILQCSAFFTVQLSHPYMTTGKTIALTRLCWQSNISAS